MYRELSSQIHSISKKVHLYKQRKISWEERKENFVCAFSLMSGQLITVLSRLPQGHVLCTRFSYRSGDRIYEIRCLFVAVGLNAPFIVLPHWDNMLI